eukprot:COSAG06_NODE_43428_length_372_cov_0.739927_1_plen_70_part_01
MPGEPAGVVGQAPPAVFLCPIGKTLMADPVLASDGVNYERAAIEVTPRAPLRSHASLVLQCATRLLAHTL